MSCIPLQDFSLINLCDATKAGKLYSIVPDDGAGDLDAARATTATYLASDGLIKTAPINTPRIEFNTDGTYKGLLVEPAATNLLLRSEEFDNAYWTKQNTTITADDTTAPDGTTTADKLVEDSSSNKHFINALVAHRGLFGGVLSNSFYAKEGEIRYLTFRGGHSDTQFYSVLFDLQEGVVVDTYTSQSGVLHNFSIQKLPNGWCRCNVSGSVDIAFTHRLFFINLIKNPNNVDSRGEESYLGNGSDGAFIWGAQIEESPVATSYIPTVASTVTRAADVISKTGISSLIGQTEGTLFTEISAFTNSGDSRRISLGDGSNNNRVTLEIDEVASTYKAFMSSGGTLVGELNFVGIDQTENLKIALTYNSSEFSLFINGVKRDTDTSIAATPIGLDRLFYSSASGSLPFYGTQKQLAILPTAITDEQAIQLTS